MKQHMGYSIRQLVVPLFAALAAFAPTAATAAVVSLPGEALILPVSGSTTVNLSIDDASGVEAALLRVQYDQQFVTATDVTRSSLAGGCVMEANTGNPNEILISMACIEPLSGGGPLFEITLAGQSPGSSALTITECTLNEGSPSCAVRGGNVTVTDCALDVDGGGSPDVATDVVYIARTLLGLSPVPSSFRALNPTIPPDAEIAARVGAATPMLDVDGNGVAEVATDVVYIARQLLGLPPVSQIFRDLDPSIPPDSVISDNIDALCP